ncbi:cold inducible RNA binding protein, isoform CRA_a, partial [Rattus norvegicus]
MEGWLRPCRWVLEGSTGSGAIDCTQLARQFLSWHRLLGDPVKTERSWDASWVAGTERCEGGGCLNKERAVTQNP